MKLPVPAWDIPCTLSSHGVVADDGCVWLCENPVHGDGDDTTSCGSSEESGTESTGKLDGVLDELQSIHGQMVCVSL